MFKKVIIDVHSDFCKDKPLVSGFNMSPRGFCDLNLERVLIQLETDFYLILIPHCIMGNKYDFIIEILKKSILNRKITNTFEYYYLKISKSITDNELSNFRLRGIELKKWVTQVHYAYSDNSGKPYYICSNVNFVEKWLGTWNADLELSYQEAKIKLNNDQYLLSQLDYLYECNIIIDYCSETEMFKTIDEFAKSIRKKNKKLTIKNQ
jgi:hypothetical protein